MSNMNMEDDGDDKDDTKRRTRNLSEKKRRDQFNLLVNELGTMVSTTNRKMDKSTVLKTTISFLKNHNEITVRSRAHGVQEDWKPAFLSNEEFTYLVLEALEGFVMVFSATGKILYVSESVTSLLGHNPADMVNKNIFDLTYEEEQPSLYNLLHRHLAIAAATNQIYSPSNDVDTIMFEVHLQRGALDFRDEAAYELVTFSGHFRYNMDRTDGDHDMGYDGLESGIVFVCTGQLHTPQLIRDVSLVDANRSEFISRHSLEWKFLFLDHRAPPIIGYLPFEVLGTSGYDYYHFDDLEKIVTCHEALMQKGDLTSCYYRFLTKGQQWIWLQTRFYITYHQWNSKPEFVVCTHRVVNFEDIAKGTKQESPDLDVGSEGDVVSGLMKAPLPEEAALVPISPTYLAEAADACVTSYPNSAQAESIERPVKDTPAEDATMTPISPTYTSVASDSYAVPYRTNSQIALSRRRMKNAHSDYMAMTPVSPSYISESSGLYGDFYRTHSQAASIKTMSGGSTGGTLVTAASTSASWTRVSVPHVVPVSENGSASGESRASNRHTALEQTNKPDQPLTPQHGIGAQFLEPAPYVGAVAVPGMLPLPLSLPVMVPQDSTDIQEQLQRKHVELQQMIVRQQEELRHVKEQLLLARLGILQPIINVPYANHDGLHLQQQGHPTRPQITYESNNRVVPYPLHAPVATHAPHPPHVPISQHAVQAPHAPLVLHQPQPLLAFQAPQEPQAPGPHHYMPQ